MGVFASVCCPCRCELRVDRNVRVVEMVGDVVQLRGWFPSIEVGSLALRFGWQAGSNSYAGEYFPMSISAYFYLSNF